MKILVIVTLCIDNSVHWSLLRVVCVCAQKIGSV